MEDSKKAIYFIVLPPRIYFGFQYNSLPGPIFGGQLTYDLLPLIVPPLELVFPLNICC